MKRVLSILVTVLMLVQMLAFTVSAEASPVYWTGESAGEVAFAIVDGVKEYSLILYKDGEAIIETSHSFGNYTFAEATHSFADEIYNNGSGTYRVEVGGINGTSPYISSDDYVYNRPSESLAKTENPVFHETNQCITWDAVEGAVMYDLWFCYSIDYGKSFFPICSYTIDPEYDSCCFDFWGEPEEELSWLEQEFAKQAEYAGISPEELVEAIYISAYPVDLNEYNPSYSDYVTFDGSSFPNDGDVEPDYPGYDPTQARLELLSCECEYFPGDEFSAEIMLVSIADDGTETSTIIDIADCRIEGFDSYSPGEQYVTIWYGDLCVFCGVYVYGDDVRPDYGYTVIFDNIKTEYYVGEDFCADVYVTTADGESYRTLDYWVEGFDPYVPGYQYVTIWYGDYCHSVDVWVYEEVTNNPSGTCGDNIRWEFVESENLLRLTGTGAMTESFYPPWKDYRNYVYNVEVCPGITELSTYAFIHHENLRNVTLPEGLKVIGVYAFYNCPLITEICIPSTVETIGDFAFYGCSSLRNVYMSKGIKTIDAYTFYDCTSLGDIYFAGNIADWASIEKGGFWDRNAGSKTANGTYRLHIGEASPDLYIGAKTQYYLGDGFVTEVYQRAEGEEDIYCLCTGYHFNGFDGNKLGNQTVTVTYGDYTRDFDVTISQFECDEPISRVYFDHIERDYYVGDMFYAEVAVETTEGTFYRVADYVVEGFDSRKTGEQTVTVSYGEFSETVEVYVHPRENTEPEPVYEVRFENVRTEYEYGESFYAEVYIYDENGESYRVDDYFIEGFDSTTPGWQTVTLWYVAYSETFEVYVYGEPEPENTVSFELVKAEYQQGEELCVKVYVNDGEGGRYQVDNYWIEGFDNTTPGWQTVTIWYEDYCAMFDVYVYETEPEPTYNVIIEDVRTEYAYGEEFFARVYLLDANGEYIEVEDYYVEGFNSRKPGVQEVTVWYENYSEIFFVTVNPKPSSGGGSSGGGGGGYVTVSPVISVSSERCKTGNTVDVVVSVSNNTGFANLGLEISYDSALTLVGVTPNSSVGATFTTAQTLDAYPYNIGFDAVSNVTYNGDLVTLTFEIAEDIEPGDYYVDVDFYKGRNGDYIDGVSVNYDADDNPLNLCYESGYINVYNYIPGDIDSNGTVNNKDGTALLRYLAGWALDNIDINALDTDGDGVVCNKDGTRLLRYLAGWEVTVH